jgi:hypothetical protein
VVGDGELESADRARAAKRPHVDGAQVRSSWIRLHMDLIFIERQRGKPLVQFSHLHMGSLGGNNIGAAGARDLGAALQVNTTLMTLE